MEGQSELEGVDRLFPQLCLGVLTSSLMRVPRLFELVLDIFFRKLSSLGPKHVRQLSLAHANLITNRYKMGCDIHVVFAQQLHCHHEPVDIVENQGSPGAVSFFRFEKVDWMISPMPPRVEVVGSVVAIVEADAVALSRR